MCEKHHGWTNRETWAANLWIGNDAGLDEMAKEVVREDLQGESFKDKFTIAYFAGEALQKWFEAITNPEAYTPEGFISGIYPMLAEIGSVWRVNWTEIGKAIVEEMEW